MAIERLALWQVAVMYANSIVVITDEGCVFDFPDDQEYRRWMVAQALADFVPSHMVIQLANGGFAMQANFSRFGRSDGPRIEML